jgi:hypothetical protein
MRSWRVVPVVLTLSIAVSCSDASGSEGAGYLRCPNGPTDQLTSVDGDATPYDTMREAAVAAGAPVPDQAEFVEVSDEHGHLVAVRVLGRTALMLHLEGEPGGWSVSAYVQC